MKKAFIVILAVVSVIAVSGCSRNPCRKLAAQVCEKSAGSEACKAAGTLTAADECEDYLANLDKFIEIKNNPVTTERLAPPAPAPVPEVVPAAEGAPAADAAPGAEAAQAPATGTPATAEVPAAEPAQAAPAPATTP